MSIDQRQQELDLRETGPVKRVEDYKFEPIRGYPMLHWAGKRPFTSTQYYPAQHKETYGPEGDGWRNKIYWGDNLQVMSHLLREYRGQVKLVYIDPPFDSKADYKKTIRVRGKEVSNDQTLFEEKQYSDIWINDEYLQFMYERLILIRELLAFDGSIYIHCDHHQVHRLRCIMDEVFGSNNFINEIVWKRTSAHSDPQKYGINLDYILYYSNDGRRWVDDNLSAKGLSGGGYEYEYKGVKSLWRCPPETMQKLDTEGKLHFTKNGGIRLKRYLDENKGLPLQAIWDDIFPVNSQAQERLNYPTQKPEALLERIVQSSSNIGDLVFDCFMGSGTLQAVSMKLARRFLGADINLGAIQISTKRLLSVAHDLSLKTGTLISSSEINTFYTGFEVYNVNNYDIFRNPAQAKELLIQALEVNPLQAGSLFDGEKDGRMVKIMPINRIATRQDLNELITGLDYKAFEQRQLEHPNRAVEKITLVCMGHEPDLAAHLKHEVSPYNLDVEVVDILRDKQDLQFKRDAEAKIVMRDGYLVIEQFYPMSLLAKLSLQQEYVEDWRELVDSVMVDWNYDGAVLQPAVIDVPERNELVVSRYRMPDDAGTIRVKITDLLSESLEKELRHG